MIPPEVRLRRALRSRHPTGPALAKRIIQCTPASAEFVRNSDPDEKGKTSLHICAELGLVDVARFLLDQGHEGRGISRTHEGITPLMIAASAGEDDPNNLETAGRLSLARMLIEEFPLNTAIKDNYGMDAFAYAAKHGAISILQALLALPPPPDLLEDPDDPLPSGAVHPFLLAKDDSQNTALHHASAFGQLKTLRFLVAVGADPTARNATGWTPVDYSASVAAEVYFKNLVRDRAEFSRIETGLVRGNVNTTRSRGGSEAQRFGGPTVKMVPSEGSVRSDDSDGSAFRIRPRHRAGT